MHAGEKSIFVEPNLRDSINQQQSWGSFGARTQYSQNQSTLQKGLNPNLQNLIGNKMYETQQLGQTGQQQINCGQTGQQPCSGQKMCGKKGKNSKSGKYHPESTLFNNQYQKGQQTKYMYPAKASATQKSMFCVLTQNRSVGEKDQLWPAEDPRRKRKRPSRTRLSPCFNPGTELRHTWKILHKLRFILFLQF